MTHQELTYYWLQEAERYERESKICFTSCEVEVKKELSKQARLAYMMLIQMETEEPITITSTSFSHGCMCGNKPMEGEDLAVLQKTSKRMISDKPTTLRK